MDAQEFDAYYSDRYEGQIQWHEKKAATNKRRYLWTQTLIIVFSVVTTTATALAFRRQTAVWLGVPICTSALVATLTALQKTFQFQELWIAYRRVVEVLRKEGYFHKFRLGEYAVSDAPDALFVEKTEGILSQQNDTWATQQTAPHQGSPRS